MRVFKSLLQIVAVAAISQTTLAASWTFSDGSISVQGKGSGVGSGLKEK
jgi:oligosaccharyltransferase complex subunit delta (ribophorin II)